MSVSPLSSEINTTTSKLVEPLQREGWMYAGFWVRVCAFLIDFIIITILFYIQLLFAVLIWKNNLFNNSSYQILTESNNHFVDFYKYQILTENNHPLFRESFVIYVLICSLLLVLYYPLFQSSRFEATPGKMFFRMRVVTYDRKRIGFWRALLRYLIKVLISFPVLCIGVLMVAFTARKEGLHDLIARTVVERKVKINIMPEETLKEG